MGSQLALSRLPEVAAPAWHALVPQGQSKPLTPVVEMYVEEDQSFSSLLEAEFSEVSQEVWLASKIKG